MTKAEMATEWMEKTANDSRHGYDQRYRWGERGDYDCSSAVITAWQIAGVPVKTKGATYTGNMRKVFTACGFKDVTKTVNLGTGAGMQRGDVLLNDRDHVAMYCGSSKLVQASINEKGTVTGGAPGDQTGREFWIRPYYNYPWNVVLRYHETKQEPAGDVDAAARAVIAGKYGNGAQRAQALRSAGLDPAKVQARVNELMKKPAQDLTAVARDVIRGKYGNGRARRNALKAAGYDPDAVQRKVNELL